MAEKHTERVTLTYPPSEFKKVKARAEKAGLRLSTYIKLVERTSVTTITSVRPERFGIVERVDLEEDNGQ